MFHSLRRELNIAEFSGGKGRPEAKQRKLADYLFRIIFIDEVETGLTLHFTPFAVIKLHELIFGPVFHDFEKFLNKFYNLSFLKPRRYSVYTEYVFVCYFNVKSKFRQEFLY